MAGSGDPSPQGSAGPAPTWEVVPSRLPAQVSPCPPPPAVEVVVSGVRVHCVAGDRVVSCMRRGREVRKMTRGPARRITDEPVRRVWTPAEPERRVVRRPEPRREPARREEREREKVPVRR